MIFECVIFMKTTSMYSHNTNTLAAHAKRTGKVIINRMQVIISNGLGTVSVPLHLFARPQLVIVELDPNTQVANEIPSTENPRIQISSGFKKILFHPLQPCCFEKLSANFHHSFFSDLTIAHDTQIRYAHFLMFV
jgi:hypothetical protein